MRWTILVLALIDALLCLAGVGLLSFVLFLNRGPLEPTLVIVPSALALILTTVVGILGNRDASRRGLRTRGRTFSLLIAASIIGPLLAPMVFLAGALANFNSQASGTMAATAVITVLLVLLPILTPVFAVLCVTRSSSIPVSS